VQQKLVQHTALLQTQSHGANSALINFGSLQWFFSPVPGSNSPHLIKKQE
jgi:hypothetical protein